MQSVAAGVPALRQHGSVLTLWRLCYQKQLAIELLESISMLCGVQDAHRAECDGAGSI